MADLTWLLLIAFGVGTLIGAVGVGGILLIPALTAFAGLPIHTAMATALFTFAFTGVAGTPRRNLVHVLANGSVAPWSPDPDSEVFALARSGSRARAC